MSGREFTEKKSSKYFGQKADHNMGGKPKLNPDS